VDRISIARAKAAFRRAIELDSNFAMAYFGLGTLPSIRMSLLRRTSLMKAWQLSDRVTEKERLAIQAQYASDIENDQAKRTAILEELLRKYPHEQREYVELANSYARKWTIRERPYKHSSRALQNDPRHGEAWNSLAYILGVLGRKREAIGGDRQYQALAPHCRTPTTARRIYTGCSTRTIPSLLLVPEGSLI